MRATLEALAAVLILILAYAAVKDDRPVIVRESRIAQERIAAAREAINATEPLPCPAPRKK